jgi:signal peptidase I
MSAHRKSSLLRELPILVAIAVIVSIIIKTFLVQFFYIPSGSMENTLLVNDRVAVNKFGNFFSEVSRGDVVVFRDTAGWLPEESNDFGSGVRDRIREGLVFIGILPDPAKQYLIKRVIGVAGDTIVCCDQDDRLTINGVAIDEPYIFPGDKASESEFEVIVPDGYIWVMGDHRGASADSRFHRDDANDGFVPLSAVTGRAVAIVWPIKNISILSRYDGLVMGDVTK